MAANEGMEDCMNIKLLAVLILVLAISGFAWLQEHDKGVAWRVLAEARKDSLEREDKITQDLIGVVKDMNTAYANAEKLHKQSMSRMRDSLLVLDSTIDTLAHNIALALPEKDRPKLTALVSACKNQVDLVFSNLTTCEALRQDLYKTSVKKDTVIRRLASSRDSYKELYEKSAEPRSDTWSKVGKATTAGAILTIVTKLVGLW